MTGIPLRYFRGRDGVRLAYRELGEGRPLILIHGYLSTAMAMVDTGIAGRIAGRGFRVILPDLRGHGASARPHGAEPPPGYLKLTGPAVDQGATCSSWEYSKLPPDWQSRRDRAAGHKGGFSNED
jgi:pimeloyl-ACP methyl ester carboxylesterase